MNGELGKSPKLEVPVLREEFDEFIADKNRLRREAKKIAEKHPLTPFATKRLSEITNQIEGAVELGKALGIVAPDKPLSDFLK